MKTLYALDIINPFNKTVKMDGLHKLLRRIEEKQVSDKVGNAFYNIIEDIYAKEIPDTDIVVEFLNDINIRKSTRKIIGFKLNKNKILKKLNNDLDI